VALTRDRVKDGKLFLYTSKTGTPVWCPLPRSATRMSGTSSRRLTLDSSTRHLASIASRARFSATFAKAAQTIT
jgi:alkylhydroperoxidase/carboxymuconolactone decarboxylase family protein YurZ